MSCEINEQDLLSVERPAQYMGGEKNAIYKSESAVDVRIALAFPDTYEVGMSHVGMQILYDIINQDPRAWGERVYTPLPDMEEILREKKIPLTSLEGKRPLNEFDIVGFSLQYELCGTNILAMLDLGQMALLAKDRDDQDPLVIGGGPYSYHPEALAPFFDLFFLGDAEEFIPELISVVRTIRASGSWSRHRALEALRSVEGIYISADFEPIYDKRRTLREIRPKNPERAQVVRRLLPTMEGAPFPRKPVVPNINTVHNRLSLEVMRGCVRGCRFCQAGYLYRPQRERPPEEVFKIIQDVLPETGFEEVSLLSLSTADYCSVVPLLRSLMDKYGEGDRLSISFPSTRVDALTPEVLEQVQRVRRTGFTVAPEGGSQRLRDVINKGVTDEQILETCSNVFSMGWSGIKLYFMLGLPTETDEDLQGIVDIARRVKALPGGTGKAITVSVSTHVPKPHTPFQWAEQITPSETIRKQRLLADGLKRVGVNFRYHDHFSSFLEGVFCRGGREIADVVVRAYELGGRLDAWKEHLSEEIWMQAFQDCDINPYYYLRERSVEETLPWDHLSCGIPKSYFAKEWRRAMSDKPTADCLTTSCSVCGACDYDTSKNVLWPRDETETWYEENKSDEAPTDTTAVEVAPRQEVAAQRIRVCYQKSDAFRFLGHLELVSVIHRAARRAELPLFYSLGFHPMPRLAFGPPLQLGIGSQEEFVDIYLAERIDPADLIARLNDKMPDALVVTKAVELGLKHPSLSEEMRGVRYKATWVTSPDGAFAQVGTEVLDDQIVTSILSTEVIREAPRKRKKGRGRKKNERKVFHLEEFLSDVKVDPQGFEFTLLFDQKRACPKPIEVVNTLSQLNIGEYRLEKTQTYFA